MTSHKNRGFSLLEMLIVVAIGFTMAGITFMTLMPLFKQNHIVAAYDTTLGAVRNYRNLSITNSQRYILTFASPGTITVWNWRAGTPVSPPPTVVGTYTLPPDVQIAVQAGFPNPGPDGFGTGATGVSTDYNCIVVGQSCLVFYPDGSAQDDIGNFNNGIVYITRPGELYSSRAVTVWGATGRVRGWRLYNQGGANKWVQQ